MKRQSVLLLLVFVLLVASVIAAIWTLIVPEYRASAEVRVRSIIPYLVFQTEDSGMIPFYSGFVNTQVSIMRSSTVLQRVLDQQEIQETQWYKKPPIPFKQRLLGNPTASHMERLRDSLQVFPRGGTEIIDVFLTDSSAKEAQLIVNTVLHHYIIYIGEMSDKAKDKLYRQLVDRYHSLEKEIEGRENISAALSRSLGTGTPQELISGKRIHLDETQARLSELRRSIAVLEWKKANADDSNDAAGRMEKQPKYHEDAEWRKRDVDVRTIQHNIATSELDPNNPEIIRATKDMKFAEELLRLRETQLDEQWLGRPINAGGPGYKVEIRSMSLEQVKQEDKLLRVDLDKQKADFEMLFLNSQLLEKENNALQHKRELFSAVRQRLDQKTMERNVPGPIEVLTPASVSSEPYKDRRIMFTAITLVLGSLGLTFSGWLLKRKRMM